MQILQAMFLSKHFQRLFLSWGNQAWRVFPVSIIMLLQACNNVNEEPVREKPDYIKKIYGKSDSIPAVEARRGEVLIAYSDCRQCHTKSKRAKGPAFEDIAEKYPASKAFIDMLAQKIISGGFGTWGKPVMDPHPHLSQEDAVLMVKYILSLRK